ncbi:helix-turn-helix domain-containing protein [Clostridium perfringens]
MSTSSYGFYDQGKRIPDVETLNKLSNYYNVSID